MLKKATIITLLSIFSFAEEESTKNWFMEFGYQASITPIDTKFEAVFDDGSSSELLGSGLSENLYLKIGKSVPLSDKYSLYPSIGFTQASLFRDDYHNDALYLEMPIFYKTEVFNRMVQFGPSVKYLMYSSLYHNNSEGRINYGFQDSWAFGLQSLWGAGDTKFAIGLEQLISANRSKSIDKNSVLLKSDVEMNGLYLNFGLHVAF
ncbi:MAG: hypothetical protein KU29_08860 [Sulfurovum sp. FS06-10]|jgi:hypothetical protein|nr:MAG: hypothetical protein KU29_08860 [Sulfurovum sp. FS06-10]